MKELDSKMHRKEDILKELNGKDFIHTLNGYTYKVVGVAWDGERDVWTVVHVRSGSMDMFVRSYENFIGHHKTGRPRFNPC
jgi:hypothetical protein